MTHASALHSLISSREQEYLSGWQRARAELDNFRKRIEHEQTTRRTQTQREIITPLLELADNFQTMIQHLPKELEDNAWAQGVTHVARRLEQLLNDYGVSPVGSVGHKFDPSQHEAVSHTKHKNTASGHIIEIIQVGYKMGDTVIRPAKVKVSK